MNISIVEDNIIGDSIEMLNMKKKITALSNYTATVLISGETGTGKELVARGLHYSGQHSGKPFIAVNCSTFSDDLFASELFGHKKGAFTDAKSDKEGLLSSIDGGTIFLDEIDCLSLKSQASLLRVLQESEYRPIGSNQVLKVNVRFIAATNSNLKDKIKEGLFRQDLYFRIYILSIEIPSLRERKTDIPLLVNHFIAKLNKLYMSNKKSASTNFMNYLLNYTWPGNVRELENCIHRHYLLSQGDIIDIQPKYESNLQLSKQNTENEINNSSDTITVSLKIIEDESNEFLNFANAKKITIEKFEAKFVSRLLYICKGNVTKAAELCGKERRAFGKMVKKYNIKDNKINIL